MGRSGARLFGFFALWSGGVVAACNSIAGLDAEYELAEGAATVDSGSGTSGSSGSTGTSAVPPTSGAGGVGESEGNRLSNTAISKCSRGISVSGPPGLVGQRGQSAVAGL